MSGLGPASRLSVGGFGLPIADELEPVDTAGGVAASDD